MDGWKEGRIDRWIFYICYLEPFGGYRRLRTKYKEFLYPLPQSNPALLRRLHFWLLTISPRVRCRYLVMAYRPATRASSPPSLLPQPQSP